MRKFQSKGIVKYNGNHRFSGDEVFGYYWSSGDKHFIKITIDNYGNSLNEDVEVEAEPVVQYTEFGHLKEYLKENLRIEIDTEHEPYRYSYLYVKLMLDGEELSKDKIRLDIVNRN